MDRCDKKEDVEELIIKKKNAPSSRKVIPKVKPISNIRQEAQLFILHP